MTDPQPADALATVEGAPDPRDSTMAGWRMMAEQQRVHSVAMKALHLMQAHHGNRYFSFKCVPRAEEVEWFAKAEALIPAADPIAVRDAALARLAERENRLRERALR